MTICPCCRSPTIVTLLRGAPNAGHDLSTSHLTKTVTGPWDLPTLSTLSAAQNEVSVFILFSVHGVLYIVGGPGPGRVSR